MAWTPWRPSSTPGVQSVVILGYPGVQALDVVGPFEVFTVASMYLRGQDQRRHARRRAGNRSKAVSV